MSRNDPPSVVVLGAAGFVGRAVCEAFTAQGARVLGVVRSSVQVPARTTSVRLDLTRAPREEFVTLLRSHAADVVVNTAGAVWGGVTDTQMHESNVELTQHLLASVAAVGQRPPRLIQLGSAHEYGAGVPGRPLDEDVPPRPVNPYGRSKLLATQAVLSAAEEGRVDGVVLRVAHICGPYAPRGSLLGMIAARLAAAARHPEEPLLPLQLSPLRARLDFVDVRDVADAIVAAGQAFPGERLINVGRGEAVSVRSVVARLIELSDLDVPVVEKDIAPSGHAGAQWQQLDITRARRLLDWQPRRTLDQSLRDLLAAARAAAQAPDTVQAPEHAPEPS